MGLIGNHLEQAGWRQGSIVRSEDVSALLELAGLSDCADITLVVASQSCDIANNDIDADPYIELSVARAIDQADGNLTHNKNPRILHSFITSQTNDEEILSFTHLELKAFEKLCIPKEHLNGLQPDSTKMLEQPQLRSYTSWLSSRYSRPALPTRFNQLIKAADPKGKIRGVTKKGSTQLTGVYVEISPDSEIDQHESYRVNLLGLLPSGVIDDAGKAQKVIDAYADIMKAAGMDVVAKILNEDAVSLAVIRRFKRFYYDDLSFRDGTTLPPEAEVNL